MRFSWGIWFVVVAVWSHVFQYTTICCCSVSFYWIYFLFPSVCCWVVTVTSCRWEMIWSEWLQHVFILSWELNWVVISFALWKSFWSNKFCVSVNVYVSVFECVCVCVNLFVWHQKNCAPLTVRAKSRMIRIRRVR